MTTPILQLHGVGKRYGAVVALSDVNLEVHAGEVVGLVGDNGAGKSTLIKTASGVIAPDAGHLTFCGEETTLRGPGDAAALGIAVVHQDLALCDNLDIVGNLFLGRERRRRGGTPVLDEVGMEQQAMALLSRLSVGTRPDMRASVSNLSGGQRQTIAIARALVGDPKVALLDEPTAALGVVQSQQVLDVVRRMRAEGLGVVIISHNIADVFAVCDRIVVLRLGSVVAEMDVASTTPGDVVAAITGANIAFAAAAAEEAL
jgi:D-xylose transport system ATP-binding protein